MAIQKVYESKYYKESRFLLIKAKRKSKKNLISVEELDSIRNNFLSTKKKLIFLSQNLRRASARRNAKLIDIDLDYLYEIGESQNWLCNLTDIPLEFERGGRYSGQCNPNSCTIDRIDSHFGYIEGNIQLLTWRINDLKNKFTQEELIDICRKISLKDQTNKCYNNFIDYIYI
jgi:hypothetical protein